MSEPDPGGRCLRVLNITLGLEEDEALLRARAAERVGLDVEAVRGLRLGRRALDARRRGRSGQPHYVVHVDLMVDADTEKRASARLRAALRSGHAVWQAPPVEVTLPPHASLQGRRVAVIGAGPAGVFAAWVLARSGIGVDLFDRGPALPERSRVWSRFLRTRELDPEANLLFGEGGAGTYSDGKIYTRIDHPLEVPILEEWIACGAPEAIAYDARAHIGTDRLHSVLPKMRARLEAQGVRFHWGTRLDGLEVVESSPSRIRALRTSHGEIPCDAVILAVGHSARDTLAELAAAGVRMEAKPFQLGVRVEHPQALIDEARYGDLKWVTQLGVSDYKLTARAGSGAAAAHSFCMCPGGQIVASVNQPGLLCTNGMSNSRHSSPYANAAVVTTLGPRETGPGAFAGFDYRERLESLFFEAGGQDWTAPAQRVDDFLAGRDSVSLPDTSYKLGTHASRLDRLLPDVVGSALRHALSEFGRKIPGYAGPEGLLVGIESRSSGCVRITRDEESRRAPDFVNLFPVGEGAGYAGGIMSACIDGARSAQALLRYGLEA